MATGPDTTGGPQIIRVDVGGVLYTTTLETLKKFPESRLAKMFSGLLPVKYYPKKQQYAIDRDGNMFRFVLNFLRNNKLDLPNDFTEHHLLLTEATYFEIKGLCEALQGVLNNLNINNMKTPLKNQTEGSEILDSREDINPFVLVYLDNSKKVTDCCTRGYVGPPLSGDFCQVVQQLLKNGYSIATYWKKDPSGPTVYMFTKKF